MHFYDGLVLDHNHSLGDDVRGSLIKKLVNFNDIIQNTYNHITESKRTRVLTVNDFKQCSNDLKSIRYAICDIYNEVLNKDDNIYDDADGKSLISSNCLPDYSVYTSEDNYRCNIKVYAPYLDQTSSYRPRLTSEIKDSYGNCFNIAEDLAENTGQQ